MKLYEHQGRDLMVEYGVPAPSGTVVTSVDEFDGLADGIEYPVVVKAQVLTGGRGKAGGIKFADTADEARQAVGDILGMDIKGLTVERVLVVHKLDLEREFYASVLVDRSARMPMLMVSAEGGVDIESVPEGDIHTLHVHPLTGYEPFHGRELARRMGLEGDVAKQVVGVLGRLYDCFVGSDAELVEVNPLALTGDGEVVAADAKVVINDAAAFRHPDIEGGDEDRTALEVEAEEKGISFVQLDGRIGVIANGAGLTMATLDAIKHFGGRGGVFLDLGGTDDPAKVQECFRLLQKADPSVILLNLFGGITKSDTVAEGVRAVLDETDIDTPIVTRIRGVNEERARELLKDAGLVSVANLQEAAKRAVEIDHGAAEGGAQPASTGGGR